jgi:hypothetical protein
LPPREEPDTCDLAILVRLGCESPHTETLARVASLQTHQGSTEGRKVPDWHDDLHEERRRGPFGLNCVVKS